MPDMLKEIRFKISSIPAMLLILTVITYGLLIPWIGFYWDDWNFAWISHFLGAGEFIPAFAPFRPFLGPIFMATTSIFHESTIAWQICGLVVRFLVAYAVWWSLSKAWPDHQRQVLTVSLFALVFPGYGQQWVAFTHVNQELIPLLAYLFSFGVTILALRNRDKFIPLTLLSLLLMFLGLFTTEYFIGLEIIRFVLIWFVLADTGLKRRIVQGAAQIIEPGTSNLQAPGDKRVHLFMQEAVNLAKYGLPYLLFWLANAAWLAYYYRAGGYHSYGMQGFKLLGAGQLVPALLGELIATISTAGFSAWFQIFGLFSQPVQSASFWLALGLGAASFIAIVFYLSKLDFADGNLSDDRWATQAIFLGLVAILAGRLPSWVAGLPISLDFSWDRFMLSMMFGACLFFAGLVELLVKSDARKFYVVGLLVALSISHQFDNANSYRRDWEQQKVFFWELSWRIPAMKPGTILLTHELPIQYESDLSLSAPLNWIYAPASLSSPRFPQNSAENRGSEGGRQLDYVLLFSTIRLGQPEFPALQPNLPVQVPFRTAHFQGSTSNTIVIYFPAAGCLKVLDPLYSNKKVFAGLPYTLTDSIALSDPSRILTDATAPVLPYYFETGPENSWCYFYEKAELARQNGDWPAVVKLGKQAFKSGFAPEEPYEWLPFIEGYARTGEVDKAAELSLKASGENSLVNAGLCEVWRRVQTMPRADAGKTAEILLQLKCRP